MNFLVIFGIILFLIILLLVVPVKLTLSKNPSDYIKVIIEVLFIPIKLTLKKKDKKTKKNDTKPKEKKPLKDNGKKPLSFKEKVIFYCSLLTNALKELKHILYHVRISDLSVRLTLSEGNAAFTAIAVGGINTAIYPLLGLVESYCKVDKGAFKVNVCPEYNTGKSTFSFSLSLHLAVIHLMVGGLKLYSFYKKETSK
ncbi:MAG: DUF2953 domain-containing protein [Ruminococcaceae bacterium]|nr:DUF2953 domain-containing protein [Oscillospiraceae bacterium]